MPKPPLTSNRRRASHRPLIVIALILLVAAIAYLGWRAWPWFGATPPEQLTKVVTLAGEGPRLATTGLSDPFGVAIGSDDEIYVTDGTGGRVFRIADDGVLTTVAEGLDMPSAVAAFPDGGLVVANTGAHTIVRIDPKTGAVTLVAGAAGERGYADGPATSARFDAPIGVAVGSDGAVYVADTYNDRIRAIAPDGTVRTIAGGAGEFDTPCGVAVEPDGDLIIADTGHSRVVRLATDGSTTVVAGPDGFAEPTGVFVGPAGTVFVTDTAEQRIWTIDGDAEALTSIAGDGYLGRTDGDRAKARFNRPTGVAVTSEGLVVVADSVNGVVRAIAPDSVERGRIVTDSVARYDVDELRAAVAPRWPYDPPDRTREIAATFGEARTENREEGVWMHNAVDIPGGYGEVVRAMADERVRRPLPAIGPGERSEFLRLSLFTYVHIRVGRDAKDVPFASSPFEVLLADDGTIRRIRLRRGTTIVAGQPVGTLNKYTHVHLTMGANGSELNPFLVVRFPGLIDTVAPTIEEVSLKTEAGAPVVPTMVDGRLRILVRAWDRTDGNAERRRLGLYRLGYDVLDKDGRRVAGEGEERPSIAFDRLPMAYGGGMLAYASGSRSWFSGPTVFVYEVTNIVRDGEATEAFLDTSMLEPGEYSLRVFAEDAFGNRTTRVVALRKQSTDSH